MERFHCHDAIIVCPLRLCHLFIGVFPRQILLGPLKNDEFLINEIICIDLANYRSFYHAILQILSTFELENLNQERKEEFCNYSSFKYFWQMQDTNYVKFISLYGDDIVQSFRLNYLEFNEVIYLFSQFVLPSLKLKNCDLDFLSKISNLKFIEIVELTESSKAEIYIKSLGQNFKDDYFRFKILWNYHQDIILILNKIKNLCNTSLLPNQIDNLF